MDIHHQRDSNIRHIQVIRNGITGQKPLMIQLKEDANRQNIQIKLQTSWLFRNDNIKELRLYDQQGVELFDEDIVFIKEGQIIYVSIYGEEFDSQCGLAQYKIINKLGHGSNQKIFLAKHTLSKQKVAIKYVDKKQIGNAEDIDRVFRQVELMKQIRHPNIVKIVNCFILQSMEVVYVMEYLQGGSLVDFIAKNDKLSEEQARSYFFQISNAVQYCHFQNIMHKDLNLENILFSDEQHKNIKLFNFSFSRITPEQPPLEQLKYMAPEQFIVKQLKHGSKVDVWALGIILYGMVFGVLPFDGNDRLTLIENIKNANFLYPRGQEVTESFKNLLSQIFVVDPKTRINVQGILTHEWTLGMTGPKKRYHKHSQSSIIELKFNNQGNDGDVEQNIDLQLSPIKKDRRICIPNKEESPKANLQNFLHSPVNNLNLQLITDFPDSQQVSISRTSRATFQNASKQIQRSPGLTDRSELSQRHKESKIKILDSPIFNKNFSQVLEKYKHTTRSFILTKQKLQSLNPTSISSPLSLKSAGKSSVVSGKSPIQRIFTYEKTKDTDSLTSESPILQNQLNNNEDLKNKVYKPSTFRATSKPKTASLKKKNQQD